MDIWLKIVLWFCGITVSLAIGVNIIFGDAEDRRTILKILGQLAAAVVAIAATAAFMHFIGKPVINWIWGLLF